MKAHCSVLKKPESIYTIIGISQQHILNSAKLINFHWLYNTVKPTENVQKKMYKNYILYFIQKAIKQQLFLDPPCIFWIPAVEVSTGRMTSHQRINSTKQLSLSYILHREETNTLTVTCKACWSERPRSMSSCCCCCRRNSSERSYVHHITSQRLTCAKHACQLANKPHHNSNLHAHTHTHC